MKGAEFSSGSGFRIFQVLAASLLIAACSRINPAPDIESEFNELFSAYMARENIPGVSFVVMKGDEVLIRRGYGYADAKSGDPMPTDQLQPVYSVSKQFAAVLILRLAEQSLVDLDAPVGRYIAAFEAEPALTVRALLRQVSGLPEFIDLPEIKAIDNSPRGTGSLADTAEIIARQPRRFAPGARFSYSNSNYTLLARIAEIATGQSFDDALQTLVLKPAGIERIAPCDRIDPALLIPGHDAAGAVWSLPPNLVPNYSGNGGLCASAEALAQWTRALGSGRILDADQLGEMLEVAPVAEGYSPPYGFGVSVNPIAGVAAISHSGSGEGWGAWASYLPERDLTIVILADRGWLWTSDLAAPVIRVLTDASERPPLTRLRLTAAERAAFEGEFEDGLFEIEVAAEADRLLLDNPPFGEPIEFWKQEDGTFLAKERPDTFLLRLVDDRLELDWLELRSYFERRDN
jgi:CubicO group peptidase (beta-lactamase class C family)